LINDTGLGKIDQHPKQSVRHARLAAATFAFAGYFSPYGAKTSAMSDWIALAATISALP
jgi:hypothetical protein